MKVKVFRFRFSAADMNAGYIDKNLPGQSIPQVIEKQINDWLAKNPTIELQRFEQPVATFDGDCIMQVYIFYKDAA